MMKHGKTTALAWLAVAGAVAAAPAAAQESVADRLQIHGYLSQGLAQSSDHSVYGIPTGATADYRNAALQFRYALSDADNLLLQFNHRRMGSSLLNDVQDDVSLDWGFYQRRVGSGSVRVGKVPMPRGILNEVRDVGTVLPFYRAPYNYYTEGVESVDGASLSQRVRLPGGFSVEATGYAGGLDFKQLITNYETGQQYAYETRAEKVLGVFAWLNAPIDGVRVGAGTTRVSFDEFAITSETDVSGTLPAVAAEANLYHVVLRGEAARFKVNAFEYDAAYAQAGVRLNHALSFWGQADVANVKSVTTVPTPTGLTQVPVEYDYARDYALSVNYAFSHNLVVKLEAHRAKGYMFDEFTNPFGPANESDYVVTSVAVSF